jgi:TDG/mug DNA glycosylase family protein
LSQRGRPTRDEIAAARNQGIRDVMARALKVLFCGINPSLYSAAVGCHFARPGNRFWPAILASGFTDRLLSPFEQRRLLDVGCGITNLVNRATATAEELTAAELIMGASRLERKVRRYRPRCVAFLGVTAYQTAFDVRRLSLGEQTKGIGDARVWVLPNPSGLNAHYQLRDLAQLFGQMRLAITSDE